MYSTLNRTINKMFSTLFCVSIKFIMFQ